MSARAPDHAPALPGIADIQGVEHRPVLQFGRQGPAFLYRDIGDDDQRARDEAGADWLSDQGFDRKD